MASIVVPAYRSVAVGATIESLLAAGGEIDFELIVVLNGATSEVRVLTARRIVAK